MFVRSLIGLAERWVVAVGILAAMLLVPLVLATTWEVVARYAFGAPTIWAYEVGYSLTGAHFLLALAYTLRQGEHIRIDVVSSFLSRRVRNWIDVVGHLFFLIPMCLVMMFYSWPFFFRSLFQNEQSTNAGGLPVYPAKFLVPLGFSLLLLQGISELIKRIAIMRGELADVSGGGHHEAAEAEAQRLRETLAEEAEARARAEAERLKRGG